jgi:hypothetical protein
MRSPQRTQRARREGDFGLRIEFGKLSRAACGVLEFLLCVLCVLCGELFADGTPQYFVPLEGAWGNATLVSIADAKVTLRGNDIPQTYKLADLVRWGNPVPPRPQTLVVLADGGQLVTAADWSGGAAVRLKGDSVVIYSDTWDEVPIPKKVVSGIVFAQRSRPEERAQLAEKVRLESAKSDVVLLTNGDRLTGTLKILERGSLTLNTGENETTLPLSRVQAIGLSSSQDEPSPAPSLKGRGTTVVGMRDGSLLYARAIEVDQNKLNIELANGLKLAGGNVGDVVALQSLGGQFTYLSDLEPASYKFVPYLSIQWPLVRDRNVLGGPFMVDGNRYLKGIGLHSAARASYKLDDKYQRFDAAIAVDGAAQSRGSVVFSVYLDRDGKWAEAYKSGTVRSGEPPQEISVDVRGATGLTLTVDYADRGDELDYADWLDARLVR